MNLSSRGSSDIIITVLIFLTLYYMVKGDIIRSGIFYGLVVHFKIYPIVYCFLFYLYFKG